MPPENSRREAPEPAAGVRADEGARRLRVSFYDRETSTLPRLVEGTWADVVETLSTHRRADCISSTCEGHSCPHKRGLAYSFAELRQGTRRAAANVLRVHALPFDIDDPPRGAEDIKALASRLKAARLGCVLSSTHGHRLGSPRLRLVIWLSRPVLLAEWSGFWAAARARLEVPADEAAKDPARLFFEPSTPSDVAPFVWANKGEPLDVDQVLRSVPPPAPAARRQPLKGTEWVSLLENLGEGCRDVGLTQLAGLLIGQIPPALAERLVHLVNATQCKPPLTDDQVDKIVGSIARREAQRLGGAR